MLKESALTRIKSHQYVIFQRLPIRQLRRLNGMLNQLAKFIPHMSEITAPMKELLKKRMS